MSTRLSDLGSILTEGECELSQVSSATSSAVVSVGIPQLWGCVMDGRVSLGTAKDQDRQSLPLLPPEGGLSSHTLPMAMLVHPS